MNKWIQLERQVAAAASRRTNQTMDHNVVWMSIIVYQICCSEEYGNYVEKTVGIASMIRTWWLTSNS